MMLGMRAERPAPRDRGAYRAGPMDLREDGGQPGASGRFVGWFFAPAATAGDGGAGHGRDRARRWGEEEGK